MAGYARHPVVASLVCHNPMRSVGGPPRSSGLADWRGTMGAGALKVKACGTGKEELEKYLAGYE